MVTAELAVTTVQDRVDLLNAVVLPSILFTAKVFTPSATILTQLVNIQKRFLWHCQMSDDPSRHKMNPDLVFTPREAGGLGLASIPVAIQTQRVKDALLWLTGRKDVYKEAWLAWIGCSRATTAEPVVAPRRQNQRGSPKDWSIRRRLLQEEIGSLLAPDQAEAGQRQSLMKTELPVLAEIAARNTPNLMYQSDSMEELTVTVDVDTVPLPSEIPAEIAAFWGVFASADNPRIPDRDSPVLTRRKYDRIRVTSIASLAITRTAQDKYTVRVPVAQGTQRGHTAAKLQRWLIAILLNSPRLRIGERFGRSPDLQLRGLVKLKYSYKWEAVNQQTVRGTAKHGEATITLIQSDDGIHWHPHSHQGAKKDFNRLLKYVEVVFSANPQIHDFPWRVPTKTRNRSIVLKLKKQIKRKYRRGASPRLTKIVEQWKNIGLMGTRTAESEAATTMGTQEHANDVPGVGDVQDGGTAARLTLYWKKNERGCSVDPRCGDVKITISHIAWLCERAQAFWKKWLSHWLGHEVTDTTLVAYKANFASRKAPAVSSRLQQRMIDLYGHWELAYEDAFSRIWWAACSIGYALLWQIRNQVVHDGKKWSAPQQREFIWTSCLRQLNAVALRERNRANTRIQGLQLKLSLDCLEKMAVEQENDDDSPPPEGIRRHRKEPALLKRLTLYQEAIN